MHGEKSSPYRAYLLRCWQEGEAAPGKEPLWRFSVEEILNERRRKGFSSLGALIAFLRAELAGGEEEPSDDKALRTSVACSVSSRSGQEPLI
jgi:hypothetical protein